MHTLTSCFSLLEGDQLGELMDDPEGGTSCKWFGQKGDDEKVVLRFCVPVYYVVYQLMFLA